MRKQRKLLTEQDAQEIMAKHTGREGQVAEFAREYCVSRPVIYRILEGTYFEDIRRRKEKA